MNKAITDGLVLMPPPFSAGLAHWSRENGTPGGASYLGQPNAALVTGDADFGDCLELQKTDATQKLRSFMQVPLPAGLYLRITARVKAISGALPSVRVAAWGGTSTGVALSGVVTTGTSVALPSFGRVVTVSAIVSRSNRTGVDFVWGREAAYAHVGLDLTGSNGGVVRIDDIEVEDVTAIFMRKMMDWVDVRDHGARGNGTTDDIAAFTAADAEASATGRSVLVSAGTYALGDHFAFSAPVRFEGTVKMAASARLSCPKNYDIATYEAAFGSEEEGFRRGLQVLFHFTDHVSFDLGGRRVNLQKPVDVAALAGITSFAQRRVLRAGMIEAGNSVHWADQSVASVATYVTSNPMQLTGVAGIANIALGARVSGPGVGREVYVAGIDQGAGIVTLSRPLWGAAGTRELTFTRYRYMLDFSGFTDLARFEIIDIEFNCSGRASAVMLPSGGRTFRLADCILNKPKDRGITSMGTGCQGLLIDQCQFLSNEMSVPVPGRTTVGLNVNTNDAKIRDCRAVRFSHFAVMAGSGNIFVGNHIFQGDDETLGVRRAGIVFTSTNIKTLITGNYIDNCFIEWGNEHDAAPEFFNEFSFGGLTVTGNIFTVNDVASSFRWLVVKPYGSGHFINGFMMNDNVFRTVNATIERVEGVDTTHASLDYNRFRNLVIDTNTFNGITNGVQSPAMLRHDQNTAATTWTVNASTFMPFGASARNVSAVVMEGAARNGANQTVFAMPWVATGQGTGGGSVTLNWPEAVQGRAQVTVRCDNPN